MRLTTKDSSSAEMFLPAASSFVFLYGNIEAKCRRSCGHPISKLERDFFHLHGVVPNQHGLTPPSTTLQRNKTISMVLQFKWNAFDVSCQQKDIQPCHKRCQWGITYQKVQTSHLNSSKPILCPGETLSI